ncbi:hypothetical protein MXD81_36720, partial [Microbacteriaceae bacterium K1510]|nr:hypothetical protein [Microbacteriaceae bacterium K1510]
SWLSGATLHISIAETYILSDKNLASVEDKHNQHWSMRLVSELAFARLANSFDVPLSGVSRSEIQSSRCMRMQTIVDYTSSRYILCTLI